jgi:hypothetical protein
MPDAKPSRQMAFQITEFQYKEALLHLVAWFGDGIGGKDGKVKIGDKIDAMVPDEKKRDRYKAVLLIALKCWGQGIEPTAVKKIVCWRNEKGEPSAIEADVDGRQLHGEIV